MAGHEAAEEAVASIKGTYADPCYWSERYAQPAGGGGEDDESQADPHFDWLATYEALQWWVDRFLPAQGSVLDMGCGNSELSVALARAHPSLAVVGIDYSPPLCGLMRELHPAAELLVGDGCRLPLRDGAVDAVVDKGCLDSLLNEGDQVAQREKWGKPVSAAQRAAKELHLSLGRAYLREMARVLAPGGHFLMISYEPPSGRRSLLVDLAEGGGWEVVEAGAEDEPSGNYLYACRRLDGRHVAVDGLLGPAQMPSMEDLD